MFNGKRVLAVIPARGGSKGIPGKNIKMIAGKPLIAYTILAARGSKYIDDVIVSTDSSEIAVVSGTFGAEVPFMRPESISGDRSKSIEAEVHAVEWLKERGREYDAVVYLQPTSPLRRSEEIDGAVEEFYSHGELGLASVCRVSENPVLTRRMDDSGVLHPLLPISSTVRRQDMPEFWHIDGAIYVNRTSDLNLDTSLNDNPIGFVMPEMRSVDIDNLDDFYRAESAIKELDGTLSSI